MENNVRNKSRRANTFLLTVVCWAVVIVVQAKSPAVDTGEGVSTPMLLMMALLSCQIAFCASIDRVSNSLLHACKIPFLLAVPTISLPHSGELLGDSLVLILATSLVCILGMLPLEYAAAAKDLSGERFSVRRFTLEMLARTVLLVACDLIIIGAILLLMQLPGASFWWLSASCLMILISVFYSRAMAMISNLLGRDLFAGWQAVGELSPAMRSLLKRAGSSEIRLLIDAEAGANNGCCYAACRPQVIALKEGLLEGPAALAEFVLGHELGHAYDKRSNIELWLVILLQNTLVLGAYAWFYDYSNGADAAKFMADPKNLTSLLVFLHAGRLMTWWLPLGHRRICERRADWFSFSLNGDTAGFRAWLKTVQGEEPEPDQLLKTIYAALFSTHPTLVQRLALADRWERERESAF